MTDHPLRRRLRAIDGRDYGSYQSLRGMHRFDGFELDFDQVPKDRCAPPGSGVSGCACRSRW